MDKIKTIDSIDLQRIAYKLAVGIVKKHPHYDFEELLGAIKEHLPMTDIKYWTLDYIRALESVSGFGKNQKKQD